MDRTETEPEPRESSLELSEAEEAQCRRYGRLRFALSIADLLVLPLVLTALTLTGASRGLLRFAVGGGPAWLGHFFFLILIGFLTRTAVLPVQFLAEQWLDRRFGLSRQGPGQWLWEWLCRSAVFGAATVLLLLPAVELLCREPLAAVAASPLYLLLYPLFVNYVYFPLLARFYPVRFLRHETFTLPGVDRVTLPVYQVQVSHKTRRVNAGIRMKGSKAAIYVTDTLIDAFTDGEERVVMAHEFGHLYDRLHLEERTRAGIAQAHRKLMLTSAQLLAGLLSLLLLQWISPVLGLAGVRDLAGFPLLAALTLTLGYAFSPLVCAEARQDERDADEYALGITGDVESYLSVMSKLRRINLEEACSGPLCRLLFEDHPSYRERVELALQYRRRKGVCRKSVRQAESETHPKNQHWQGGRHVQRPDRR